MSIDSLEQSESDPDVNGRDVEVASEDTVDEWSKDGTKGENKDLKGMSILCGLDSHASGCVT